MKDDRTSIEKQVVPEDVQRFIGMVNEDSMATQAILPEDMKGNVWKNIQTMKEEHAREYLSDEEKELIRLGKIYKKKKKMKKYWAFAAVFIMLLALGITSVGGPKRMFEKVSWIMAGREQTNIDSENEDVVQLSGVEEEEAYQQIKNDFGIEAVRMYYLPNDVEYMKANVGDEIQGIQLFYGKENKVVLEYFVAPSYRSGSLGIDKEEETVERYVLENRDVQIEVKSYQVEGQENNRWVAEFLYQDIYYSLHGADMKKAEFEKILKNLYFF